MQEPQPTNPIQPTNLKRTKTIRSRNVTCTQTLQGWKSQVKDTATVPGLPNISSDMSENIKEIREDVRLKTDAEIGSTCNNIVILQ